MAFVLAIVFPFSSVYTNSSQPPAGRTGCTAGTDETTCGTGACHNNTPNTGGGTLTVSFSDPELKYTPGQVYDMAVTASEAGMVKFGFEITSVDADGDSVGILIIPNGTTNISAPTSGAVNNRKYLGHKTASSNNIWNFQWKAPALDKGQLCFYAAGNCANGNGTSSGDHIYTTSLCILPDSADGIFSPGIPGSPFSIVSIANNIITLQYNQTGNDPALIRLYDLQGKNLQLLVDDNETGGLKKHAIALPHSLVSGVYLIRYTSGNTDEARKFFIQK
ncbi:MAG: choice-of-anchor V domain-containing protein [Chitinophagales bacterium]